MKPPANAVRGKYDVIKITILLCLLIFVILSPMVDLGSLPVKERLIYAKDQVVSTFKKVFPYILIGVGIGAVIHNWIPESWIRAVLGGRNPFGVIIVGYEEDKTIACVAIKKISDEICEGKRLFIRPEYRGKWYCINEDRS